MMCLKCVFFLNTIPFPSRFPPFSSSRPAKFPCSPLDA